MRKLIPVLAAVTLLLPVAARAAGETVWVGPTGAWGTYAMDDVNADIALVNAAIGGAGVRMDEVRNGMGLGGVVGVDLPGPLSFGAGYERLFASTDASDGIDKLEYKMPANAFRGFGEYRFIATGPTGVSLGLGAGVVSTSGEVVASSSGTPLTTSKVTGTGPLIEALAGVSLRANSTVALTGEFGYRYAKVGEVKVDGEVSTNTDGSKYTIDYSGVMLRAGIRLALGH